MQIAVIHVPRGFTCRSINGKRLVHPGVISLVEIATLAFVGLRMPHINDPVCIIVTMRFSAHINNAVCIVTTIRFIARINNAVSVVLTIRLIHRGQRCCMHHRNYQVHRRINNAVCIILTFTFIARIQNVVCIILTFTYIARIHNAGCIFPTFRFSNQTILPDRLQGVFLCKFYI